MSFFLSLFFKKSIKTINFHPQHLTATNVPPPPVTPAAIAASAATAAPRRRAAAAATRPPPAQRSVWGRPVELERSRWVFCLAKTLKIEEGKKTSRNCSQNPEKSLRNLKILKHPKKSSFFFLIKKKKKSKKNPRPHARRPGALPRDHEKPLPLDLAPRRTRMAAGTSSGPLETFFV